MVNDLPVRVIYFKYRANLCLRKVHFWHVTISRGGRAEEITSVSISVVMH